MAAWKREQAMAPDDQRLIQHLMRTRLDCFVQQAFISTYDKRLEPAWFQEPFCYALQSAAEAKTCRLLVTMPPRHLKSFSAAVCLPAFLIGNDPTRKIMIAVYSSDLAEEHMRLLRPLLDTRWFQTSFPDCRVVRADSGKLVTSRNGEIRFIFVGGPVTGLGNTHLIVDDIIKAQDVVSAARRKAAEDFVRKTCVTRNDDPQSAHTIAIMQRLHVHDLPSALVATGYQLLNLPSIAERNQLLDAYGGRQVAWREGELLWPQRYTHAVLEQFKIDMGEAAFSAQFLQAPRLSDGILVNLSRLRFVDEPFARDQLRYVVISVDPAVRDAPDCDYSAISVFGFDGRRWCLMDVIEKRLDYPDLKEAVHSCVLDWDANDLLIENGHTGWALFKELTNRGLNAWRRNPNGSKAERLNLALEALYSGDVVFPRGLKCTETLLDQFRSFPDGHDDVLDSVTQFINWIPSAPFNRFISRATSF